MALEAGIKLGPYEILDTIGAGGMGEVYRARDTRLDRSVAIKVLAAGIAGDPDLRARFEREARAVAALDHPHICGIYDVGDASGTHFLVMPYLAGQTLAARLEKGPFPLDQALRIATEIADALDKAHRQGIIHRDLKPANVMLTKAGSKLLDFGLAKLKAPAGPISMSGMTRLATPVPATARGTILGTVQYMAPELVEGREADGRSDIWALGAVIYEMVTGTRPFRGDTPASIIGAILKDEPAAIATIKPLAPPLLDHIVRRCLAKDPDERWQTAADLMRELKWVGDGAMTAPPGTTAPRPRTRLAWSIAGLAVLAAAALSVPASPYFRRTDDRPPVTRFDIAMPPTNDAGSFALSLDGRQLAFVATAEGAPHLWVRPLDQVTAHPLVGTEGASDPFWAPDGKAIGFFAAGKLKRVELASGTLLELADAPSERGGSWSRDGTIVFARTSTGPLRRVPATGGTPVAVTQLAPGQSHRWPQALPDGRHFLFLVWFGRETRGVYLAALDGGEATRVLLADSAALFAPPGVLLFVRQDVLFAQRFEPTGGTLSGDPLAVARGVGLDSSASRGSFAVSDTGVLVHSAGGREQRQLVWIDRAGKVLGGLGAPDPNNLANPELAPEGRRVAVNRNVLGNPDIWLIDIGRDVATRFTSDASIDNSPLWSPDGLRVAFRSNRNGVYDLFERPASAARDEQVLLATGEDKNPMAWSPDGKFLLYTTQHPNTRTDLWALPLVGDRKPFPVVETAFDETGGQFSPDGRWVAYESNASNQRLEVYLQPFPGPGGTFQVSTAGGSQPRWRPDGKELFYVAPDGRLMAAPIAVAADRRTLEAGAPVALFLTQFASGRNIFLGALLSKAQYAVASDGRFLMNAPVEVATPSPITVVLNWDQVLETWK